jgi:hypothetical protein
LLSTFISSAIDSAPCADKYITILLSFDDDDDDDSNDDDDDNDNDDGEGYKGISVSGSYI